MRIVVLLCLSVIALLPIDASGSCIVIHGRAHLYGGDGQLRIWRIGNAPRVRAR